MQQILLIYKLSSISKRVLYSFFVRLIIACLFSTRTLLTSNFRRRLLRVKLVPRKTIHLQLQYLAWLYNYWKIWKNPMQRRKGCVFLLPLGIDKRMRSARTVRRTKIESALRILSCERDTSPASTKKSVLTPHPKQIFERFWGELIFRASYGWRIYLNCGVHVLHFEAVSQQLWCPSLAFASTLVSSPLCPPYASNP